MIYDPEPFINPLWFKARTDADKEGRETRRRSARRDLDATGGMAPLR